MASDRIPREGFDDYTGADPGRQPDANDEPIRGIADEGDDELEDADDLEDEEDTDGTF
jgi:hypothetical protein